MKVLLIGSGGREHALAVRMLKDPGVDEVIVHPGNAGMKSTSGVSPTLASEVDFGNALELYRDRQASLVVIGPEWPLFQGWVDHFSERGIPAFGPRQNAAFLEESKIKAKQFMKENGIPTADFQTAQSLEHTLEVIRNHPEWDGYVLKLSGPALGKGVVVTRSADEAIAAAREFFEERPAGIEDGLVVEELIDGREVSLFYVCAGEQYQYLTSACDHKRLRDGDQGPNTGGMGAYSPANWISDEFLKCVERDFVKPTLSGMKNRQTPFTGVLFLGLMVREGKAYLLEYNTRFGDPETQAILPRLEGNFTGVLLAAAKNDSEAFGKIRLKETPEHSLHIVKAAKGYPGMFGQKIEAGKEIHTDFVSGQREHLYFAGVKDVGGKLVTSGGRVLGITVLGDSIGEVQLRAYEKAKLVKFEGEHFRTDIGAKR